MGKNNNIFVKLLVEKDTISKNLALNVHFDSDTPNFYIEKNAIFWFPTTDELDLVNEAFEMLSKYKFQRKIKEHTTTTPHVETKKEENLKKPTESKTTPSKIVKDKTSTGTTSSLSDTEKKDVDEWFV
jgi:hypothetical protein